MRVAREVYGLGGGANGSYTISHHKLSFWAAASALWALAAARGRARPQGGRAHPKKALASKWYYTICNQKPSEWERGFSGGQPCGLAAALV